MLHRRDLADLPESHPDFQKTQTEPIPHPVPDQPFSQRATRDRRPAESIWMSMALRKDRQDRICRIAEPANSGR